MSWFSGPFENNVVLLGLQVFWWKRIFSVVQMLSGFSLLVDLISREKKQALHDWLLSLKGTPPARPKATRWEAARSVLLVASVLVAVSVAFAVLFGLAAVRAMQSSTTAPLPPWVVLRATAYYFPTLLILSTLFGVTALMTIRMTVGVLALAYSTGRFHLLPNMARCVEPDRFDRTVAGVSLFLFVLSSVMQLVLS